MALRILTIMTGPNLPRIRQGSEPEPSIINEKTIAEFTRVVDETRHPGPGAILAEVT